MEIIANPLPDWQVRTIGSSKVPQASDFHGQPLLILLMSRGCNGCMGRAMPYMMDLGKSHPELARVAIHTEMGNEPRYSDRQIDEVRLFFKMDFPLLVDLGQQTYDLYRAEGTPHWILVNQSGIVDKSIWGSMDNARQRILYWLDEQS